MKPSATNLTVCRHALALGVVLLASAARGATPCASDIEKFCSKVPIGSGRIQACLAEHEKELSPECAAHYKTLEKDMGALAAICRYDIARFCWDVSPGQGRVAKCLEQHESDLSPVCKDRLRKAGQPVAR